MVDDRDISDIPEELDSSSSRERLAREIAEERMSRMRVLDMDTISSYLRLRGVSFSEYGSAEDGNGIVMAPFDIEGRRFMVFMRATTRPLSDGPADEMGNTVRLEVGAVLDRRSSLPSHQLVQMLNDSGPRYVMSRYLDGDGSIRLESVTYYPPGLSINYNVLDTWLSMVCDHAELLDRDVEDLEVPPMSSIIRA